MKKRISGLIIIGCQLLIVSLFFMTMYNDNIMIEKYVSTIHNENLNKIATSVSLLFMDEKVVYEEKLEDLALEELPSVAVVKEEIEEIEDQKETKKSTPLTSIDADKYIDNVDMGFEVTENNKQYNLSGYEFDVVVAVVSGEFDKNLNDALGVVSVILNRCDSKKWTNWAGDSPYDQVVKAGQFEVYSDNYYLDYMPGGSKYNSMKYEIAKQAVIDGLNGIRNNEYLGFRAWWISAYSDKYIISGGNRYGFN